jgi:hypothetical protein
MRRLSLLIIALSLVACAAVQTVREPSGTRAPLADLRDLPEDAQGEFGTCMSGVAFVRAVLTIGTSPYSLLYAHETLSWVLVSYATQQVWFGVAREGGRLITLETLTLAEAQGRYPDPCLYLSADRT